MRRSVTLMSSLVLSLTAAGLGVMQNAQADPLTNVRAVKLNAGDIGPMGQDCWLTKDAIEAAFFAPLHALRQASRRAAKGVGGFQGPDRGRNPTYSSF